MDGIIQNSISQGPQNFTFPWICPWNFPWINLWKNRRKKKIKPFRKYCIGLLTGHINLSRLTFAKVCLINITISTDILEMGLEPMTLGLLDLRSNRLPTEAMMRRIMVEQQQRMNQG